jgi:glycosyltransferase involved in cell wall biosynthesis
LKIAIATVQVPFTKGGAETLVLMLRNQLQKRGHQVDIVSIPFKWYPPETLVNCMLMGRMMDLSEVNGEKIDMVIATKFPAYYVQHKNKVIWLMHQHRQAYDLWGTQYGDLHVRPDGDFIRKMIVHNDTEYIAEAKRVFTIAQNISDRLKRFNDILSIPLYHPPLNHERLTCAEYGDFIFYPSRIDEMKRQHVLVEAARYLKTEARIYIAGGGSVRDVQSLQKLIEKHKLQDKIKLLGYITEDEKIDYYARCLAVYFGAFDEDYGYVTLEAFYSKKPVIVHTDAGGPLEFVEHEKNGYVLEADPKTVAQKIDELYSCRDAARELGKYGFESLLEKHISWDNVIDNLLMS